MSDAHGGLGAQNQVADSQLVRTPHQEPQQRPADALTLCLWPDGKRTDLSLIRAGDDLASMRPGLEHDRSHNPLGLAARGARVALRTTSGHGGHEDLTVAISAEPAQGGRVTRVRRNESVADVGGDPDVADLRHLAWHRGPNAHHTEKLRQPDAGAAGRRVLGVA
jgi:hypothetical protein